MGFGVHLFGERLPWGLKEMWVNVLDRGGRQAMHNHANSFISGVVYLTPTHPGSQTVFIGIADCTRVSTPIFSRAFWTASAFITVASMPI